MSQVSGEAICRRIAEFVQTAWTDVAEKVTIGPPRTKIEAPNAAVIAEQVDRVDGFIRWNRYSYTVTVYGRFPWPDTGTIEQAKDERINDLYDAVIPADGNLLDSEDAILAQLVQMTTCDRRDYIAEGEREYDVAVTFTMQRDRLR